MNYVEGENIIDEIGVADIIILSSCSAIKKLGEIDYPDGAITQFIELFPDLSKTFTDVLAKRSKKRLFGFLHTKEYVNVGKGGLPNDFGLLQVSRKKLEPANLDVVKYSVAMLNMFTHKWGRIAMTMPGVGLGQLDRNDVMNAIKILPGNVYVYDLGKIED